MKVLFVYPNVTRDRSPQLGLCSLAAIVRAERVNQSGYGRFGRSAQVGHRVEYRQANLPVFLRHQQFDQNGQQLLLQSIVRRPSRNRGNASGLQVLALQIGRPCAYRRRRYFVLSFRVFG